MLYVLLITMVLSNGTEADLTSSTMSLPECISSAARFENNLPASVTVTDLSCVLVQSKTPEAKETSYVLEEDIIRTTHLNGAVWL